MMNFRSEEETCYPPHRSILTDQDQWRWESCRNFCTHGFVGSGILSMPVLSIIIQFVLLAVSAQHPPHPPQVSRPAATEAPVGRGRSSSAYRGKVGCRRGLGSILIKCTRDKYAHKGRSSVEPLFYNSVDLAEYIPHIILLGIINHP
jgi:hypothetical protein